MTEAAPQELGRLVAGLGVPVLVGVDRRRFEGAGYSAPSTETDPDHSGGIGSKVAGVNAYNSAVLVDRSGQIIGPYDKNHLVMFGEYVPFAKRLPFLDRISSISGSVEAGAEPVAMCTGGVCYAPNICYETVMPHVIRRQVTKLVAEGKSPDVLVNLTNDAWYWGSCELAQHLACGVFRAVETRRPLVIAANGGISAWIDDRGLIRAESPIQKPDVIIADVEVNRGVGESFYMRTGDWFAGVCLACSVLLAMIGWQTRRKSVSNPQL
jgi:apolipoprotein N-acyltransferase